MLKKNASISTPSVFRKPKSPSRIGTGVAKLSGLFFLYASLLIVLASPLFVYIAAAADLENQIRASLERAVADRLNLPKSNFLLEITDFKRAVGQPRPFDKIEILPSRRPIRKGVQMVSFGLFDGTRLLKDFQAKVRIRTFEKIVVVAGGNLARYKVIREKQRAFEINSRAVRTAESMLEVASNLKR